MNLFLSIGSPSTFHWGATEHAETADKQERLCELGVLGGKIPGNTLQGDHPVREPA